MVIRKKIHTMKYLTLASAVGTIRRVLCHFAQIKEEFILPTHLTGHFVDDVDISQAQFVTNV